MDVNQCRSRYPDAGLGMGRVTFYNMPSMPDNHWVGGYYFGQNGNNPFAPPAGRIIASSGNQITTDQITWQWKNYAEGVTGDGPGYIIKALAALDSARRNGIGRTVPSIYGRRTVKIREILIVEARVRLYAFDLSGLSDVEINGLTLKAASVLMPDAQNCIVDDCLVLFPAPFGYYYDPNDGGSNDYGSIIDGTAGIFVSGNQNIIRNSYIGYSWGCGITLQGENQTVENCIIEETNWRGHHCCAINVLGKYCTIQYNTIHRTGHSGIYGGTIHYGKYGTNMSIQHNKILKVGYLSADLGPFYENLNGGDIHVTLAYNICYANYGKANNHGLYMDNASSEGLLHHNVVIGDPDRPFAHGIFINSGDNSDNNRNVDVFHNTVWNGGTSINNAGNNPTVVMRNNHSGSGNFISATTSNNRGDVAGR